MVNLTRCGLNIVRGVGIIFFNVRGWTARPARGRSHLFRTCNRHGSPGGCMDRGSGIAYGSGVARSYHLAPFQGWFGKVSPVTVLRSLTVLRNLSVLRSLSVLRNLSVLRSLRTSQARVAIFRSPLTQAYLPSKATEDLRSTILPAAALDAAQVCDARDGDQNSPKPVNKKIPRPVMVAGSIIRSFLITSSWPSDLPAASPAHSPGRSP